MGRALARCAEGDRELEVVGQVDLGDEPGPAVEACDVVVDFSFHEATLGFARLAARSGKAMVIGTTGHSPGDRKAVGALSERIPMVWASNYSTGVNALFWLARKAAEILGPGFDLEVIEMHHRHKRDAPSGTAATLAEILAQVRNLDPQADLRHGRQGIPGARSSREIGMHSLRGGDVVGDHAVICAGEGERLELAHRAASRDTFAQGALRAAKWIRGKAPGPVYSMQDVLGLDP